MCVIDKPKLGNAGKLIDFFIVIRKTWKLKTLRKKFQKKLEVIADSAIPKDPREDNLNGGFRP